MAATITIPGASQSVTATYTSSGNASLATTIANTLDSLFTSGALSIASVGSGSSPPAPPGTTNELEVAGGGSFDVPGGYQYVVTNTADAVTINGGSNLIAGNNNVQFTNTAGATSHVVAGNGSDTFSLSGSYTVAAGSGADSFNLSGNGVVSTGGGLNAINVVGGADTIFAGPATSGASGSLVNGGHGGVFFVGANNPTTTGDTIVGGTGGSTVVGGNNELVDYINSNPTASALLVAGAGNETLVAAASAGTDALYASQTAGTNDLLLGSASGNSVFVGGAGTDSLIGGGGHDVFYVLNATAFNLTPGKDLIFNANPNDSLALIGYDTLYGGAAGSDIAAKTIKAALGSGSSVTLKDGTTVTFANTSGPNGINIVSS